MHFRLPKPLHGWREFSGEVGIIVIGVLIALALEAVADDLSWRSKVGEARTELRHEVGHNLALLDQRISQQACTQKRLDQLAVIITRAGASDRLPPLGDFGSATVSTWPTSVWDSQIAAQTITHFPAEQTAAMGRVYGLISVFHQNNIAEAHAWLRLSSMVGPGRQIDAASVSGLIDALKEARLDNAIVGFEKQAMEKVLAQGALGRDFPQIDPKSPPVLASNHRLCDPIGKPPVTY